MSWATLKTNCKSYEQKQQADGKQKQKLSEAEAKAEQEAATAFRPLCTGLQRDEKAPALHCPSAPASPQYDACQTTFSATPKRHLLCKGNGQPSALATTPRVLFVSLASLYTAQVAVESLDVRGQSLIITFDDPFKPPAEPTAVHMAVLGGDYLPDSAAVGSADLQQLDLVPRCGQHRVSVEGNELAAPGAAAPLLPLLLANGKLHHLDQCMVGGHRAPPADVVVPYSLTRSRLILNDQTAHQELNFEQSWDGGVPPASITLRPSQLHFGWAPHCAYPAVTTCPEASLPGAGLQCPNPTLMNGVCQYTCGGAVVPTRTFDLPQQVVFSLREMHLKKQGGNTLSESWTDQLYHAGEELRGYTAPPQRHIVVDFASWSDRDEATAGQRVDYVEVRSPGGTFHRVKVKPAGQVVLGMPGIGCNDHVSYRPIGDREHEERVEKLEHGVLTPAQPREVVRDKVFVGLAAGGGIKPAFGMLGDRKELAEAAWLDFFAGSRHPRLRFRSGFVPNAEARAALAYTRVPYLSRNFPGSNEPPVLDSVPYLWLPLTASGIWDLPQRTYIQLGGGAAFGLALRSDDSELAPTQWAPTVLALAGVRLPHAPISFELSSRWFFGQFYDLRFDQQGGQPRADEAPLISQIGWSYRGVVPLLLVGLNIKVSN